MYISLNGRLFNIQATKISPLNEAFLYGYGLFETIKVHNRRPFFLDKHIKRLEKGCSILKLQFIYSYKIIEKFCYELIKKNELTNGALRISYSKNMNDYILLISTREISYTEANYKEGYRICFADIKRNPCSPLVYLKSNNYLENLLERQRAQEKGFDEAIFFNIYGNICEGTISNIFFVKNNKIFTPDISCGILSGILRNKVIDTINNLDLEINMGNYDKKQLYDAEEIFITNSLMDIMPICSLEDRQYDIKNSNITSILMKEIKELYNG